MSTNEKSYFDFMSEITPADLYSGLLAHGLFSEKLPPVFTSKPFFDYVQANSPTFQSRTHKYVYYENMRNINVPRPLAIPNPFAYQQLCAFLRDNWPNLQAHFQKQTKNESHRVSRIHLRKMYQEDALTKAGWNSLCPTVVSVKPPHE